jgi:myo-inositol-1(or 4)-monophosphatase
MEEYLEKVSRPDDLAVALQAAQAAGNIMDRYQRELDDIESVSKSHANDKVTEADLEAQEKIVEIISEEFPDDGFTGEEDLETEGYSRRNWIIDPIDGTSNFERRIKFFCTSIALEVDGEYVLGVVYSPQTGIDEMYFGCHNSGAYRINDGEFEELKVSRMDELESTILFGDINDKDSEERKRDFQLVEKIMEQGSQFRRPGSAALELSMVASGSADAAVFRDLSEWDFAAGKVILEEAGGEVNVKESSDGGYSVLATNSALYESLGRIFESYRPE